MSKATEHMLIMKNVSKTFNAGTINEKQVLKGINLELKKGDFATIVGSNGAGKSTLFNAITGAFLPDRGLIMLDGEDITYEKEHVRCTSACFSPGGEKQGVRARRGLRFRALMG